MLGKIKVKRKDIISFSIIILLIVFSLLVIIKAVLHKDYQTLIEYLSMFVSLGVYQVLDSKVVKSLRQRAKDQDMFNAIIWIMSIILVVTNFVLLLITFRNKLLESVFDGLIKSSVFISVIYFNKWMEEDEKTT